MENKRGIAMPLVKVKGKFQVTIPNETRREIHIEVGDILEVETQGNVITLTPKAVVDREDVENAINEGLKDLKEGRVYGPFASVEEFERAIKEFKKSKKI